MKTKISRREFLKVATLTGVAAGLAACAPTPTPAPTQPAAIKATDVPMPLKGTTIKCYLQDMDVLRYWEKRSGEFEKATGIKVTFEFVSWPILLQQGEVELGSGSSNYDVTINPFVKSMRYMRAGWEAPLDEFIAKDKWDLSDFIPTVMAAHTYKGSTYALPYLVESSQMIYRKDILDAAGLKPPATFDELDTVLEKTQKLPDFYSWVMRTQPAGFHFPFPAWLQGYGGEVFKKFPDDMTPMLNSPESAAAFEKCCNQIMKYSIAGSQIYDMPDCQAALQQGKAGIWIDALGILSPVMDPAKGKLADKFAYALPPAGPKKRAPQFATHGLMIPKNSKNKAAAWEFIKWATSKELLMGAAIDSTNSPCPRKSVLTSAEYAKKYTIAGKNLGDLINEAVSAADCGYRTAPEFAEIGSRMGQAAGEVISKQKSVKDALDSLQKDTEAILKKAGYKIG